MESEDTQRSMPHSVSQSNSNPSQTSRNDAQTYPVVGPMGGMRSRSDSGFSEVFSMQHGVSRRRVIVACARCRKRKIRCSGESRNGLACMSCRNIGLESDQCVFHRVGSDNLDKVVGEFNGAHSLTNMANASAMPSYYANNNDNGLHPHPLPSHPYPQLDTKPAHPSTWTVPYSEDTSTVDTYTMDQSSMYLADPTAPASTSLCGMSSKWVQPALNGTSAYMNPESAYVTHGLPPDFRSAVPNDAMSLEMKPLQMTLVERSRVRNSPQVSKAPGPQRQLPVPQPSPALASQNIVDQLQNRRLHSVHTISTSTMDSKDSFAKPTLSWSAESNGQVESPEAKLAEDAAQAIASMHTSDNSAPIELPTTTDGELCYSPSTTVVADSASADGTSSQMQIGFETPELFGGMNMPAPAAAYSNFRGYRAPNSSSAYVEHPESNISMYSFGSGRNRRRPSSDGGSSSEHALVSGHQYTPLSHQSMPSGEQTHQDNFAAQNVPLHHTPVHTPHGSY